MSTKRSDSITKESQIMKKSIIVLIVILISISSFALGWNYSWNKPNNISISTGVNEQNIKALIKNLDSVLKEYAPVEFVRPLTTEEANYVFSFLYHRQYFRARFRENKDNIYYHLDLPGFRVTKVYEEYYNGPNGKANVSTLRKILERVDRRQFYRHVVAEIAGDKNVYSVQQWVAQNISNGNFMPDYENNTTGWPVIDGGELIFIGYGWCGQTNRLLASLLKFGAEQEVRVVGTSSHIYVEWKPDGGKKRILDADFLKDRYLPSISTEALIKDFEKSRKIIDFTTRGNYSGLNTSTAYIAKEKGDAWFVYYDISLSKDGTKLHQKSSPKIYYQSPGHKKVIYKSVNIIQEDTTKVEIEFETENVQIPMKLYVWTTKNSSGYSREELATYDWLWDVVAESNIEIGPEDNRVVVDMKKALRDGDYTIVLAVSSGEFDLWGFYNAHTFEKGGD